MIISTRVAIFVLVVSLGGSTYQSASAFAPSFGHRGARSAMSHTNVPRSTRLYSEASREMRQIGFVNEDPAAKRRKRDRSSLLSAVAIDAPMWESGIKIESLWSTIQPVLATALLVTGNTVGASALVLPEMAARPGMAASTMLFLGTI